MTVREYLENQGLIPLPENEYGRILTANFSPTQLTEFQRLSERFGQCGDEQSTRAFYEFYYGTRLPDGISLCQLWERCFFLSLIRSILPYLNTFCATCEGSRNILDAGCGNALQLGYLALCHSGISFIGVDRVAQAITLARERFARLTKEFGLRNVVFFRQNCFELPRLFKKYFDAVILVNVLDDEREAYSEFIAAQFNTRQKLTAIRELLTPNGKVWLSLTPYPQYTDAFGEKLLTDIKSAGFTASKPVSIPYEIQGKQNQHMAWILEIPD